MSHPSLPTKDSRIVIVGASLLGLSTALHLSSRGYQSVTLLDRQQPNPSSPPAATTTTKYAPLHYTSQYHALSLAALTTWAQWNESLWSTASTSTSTSADTSQQQEDDRLWINNGFYTLFEPKIPETALQKIAYLERRHGLKLALLASSEPDHVDSAVSRMFCIDPFQLENQQDDGSGGAGEGGGVLDTLGGTILVDAAWSFAIAKVKGAPGNVRVIFDGSAGLVEEILFGPSTGSEKKARGVKTKDGKTHAADLVIWACDPSGLDAVVTTTVPLLPGETQQPAMQSQTESSLFTEKTTVFEIQISQDENPNLWDRFGEDNFPSWTHTLLLPSPPSGEAGILTGFPRDAKGTMRIELLSTTEKAIHHQRIIKSFLAKYLPDLLPLPQTQTTTSRFHHSRAVVDFPPHTANTILLARDPPLPFMFLPVIGAAVVDVLEGKPHAVKGWRWPKSSKIKKSSPKL